MVEGTDTIVGERNNGCYLIAFSFFSTDSQGLRSSLNSRSSRKKNTSFDELQLQLLGKPCINKFNLGKVVRAENRELNHIGDSRFQFMNANRMKTYNILVSENNNLSSLCFLQTFRQFPLTDPFSLFVIFHTQVLKRWKETIVSSAVER